MGERERYGEREQQKIVIEKGASHWNSAEKKTQNFIRTPRKKNGWKKNNFGHADERNAINSYSMWCAMTAGPFQL